MADDFPYRAEYAKSSRASCKACKGNIQKDTLRLAVMIQSPMFDGKVPHWYHQMCFFTKQKPSSVEDIAHFDSLRWDDQQKLKQKLEASLLEAPKGAKGKKAKGEKSEFSLEYAKSGRAACVQCEEKILKGEIRIGKIDFQSDSAKRFGPMYRWNHVNCFTKAREHLEFFAKIDSVPGFNTLSAEDKKTLRESLPEIKGKRKAEPVDEPDTVAKKPKLEDDKTQKQNKKMYSFRDGLQKNLKKAELADLLYHNDYTPPKGDSKILDVLADLMTFGALHPCEVCKTGDYVYVYGKGYVCKGKITEWTNCENTVDIPKRKPFTVPDELREAFPFLNKYKFKDYGPRNVVKINKPEANNNGANPFKKVEEMPPLHGMTFVIIGKSLNKTELTAKITSLGGKVASTVNKKTTAIVTTAEFLDSGAKNRQKAEELGIQIIPDDYFEEVQGGGAVLMLEKKNMASWGSSPLQRMTSSVGANGSKTKSGAEERFTKSVPDKMKIMAKGGAAVDPDAELDCNCHVYQRGGKIYSSVLGMVDISRGSNSYYKLQIIESDHKHSWWVFRSWGRIGTTIGGNKLEDMEDAYDAIRHFEALYEEKTGNSFNAKDFNKVAGAWYPIDIDYGQDTVDTKVDVKKSKSKLADAIKNFVSIIFDVDSMKSALVEYEIDLKKMPLGKISKKQIEKAYMVLDEAQKLLDAMDTNDVKPHDSSAVSTKVHLLDCSNRFYTLIPHDFGMKSPPRLDNQDIIKEKVLMLDNLSEIAVAYSLLKSEDSDTKGMDTIDKHYKKLKTTMEVLDENNDEFKMVKKYLTNTHASTHAHYGLKLKEVFKIERQGEKKRFKPFQKLGNHQLLWHGSRTTNFAGILSQGLRIAPPEAPCTGYMFGKGIYFADMVSKSANYCCTSKRNPTGFLMLCDVALGETYDRTNAEYVTKLPSGKHSTFGQGMTCPDPKKTITIEDKIKVPLGKPILSNVKNSSLLYNEYIVYDIAQIHAKYLLEVDFDYKF